MKSITPLGPATGSGLLPIASKTAKIRAEAQWETDLRVYACGGDGTLFEVINGVNGQVPVGVIPCGSGNDFVKNKADTYGGAIYNNAELTITGNTTFEANEAVSGGALYNFRGSVDFAGEVNVFRGNVSSGESGAIHNDN